MVSLYNSEICQILPDTISKDPEVKALSYAISRMVKRVLDFCKRTPLYAAIDEQTDEILDLMAVELDAQYYDTSLPIENKRSIIKKTLAWYCNIGTPSTVEELVRAVFGEGEVSEWFEYGDSAYYFKITTNAQLTPELFDKLTGMINKVISVRSKLRNIEIHREVELPERFISGVWAVPHRTVTNSPQINRNTKLKLRGGAGIWSTAHIATGNGSV